MGNKKNQNSIFGVTLSWRRFIQLVSVFFLMILCSQSATLLGFYSAKIQVDALPEEIAKQRIEAFNELAVYLNELFADLNYTIFEYYARYTGHGLPVEKIWYDNPFKVGEYKFDYNPLENIRENYVQIGRFVSYCGEKIFEPLNLVCNGEYVGILSRAKHGEFKRGLVISQFKHLYVFQYELTMNAHDQYLSYDAMLDYLNPYGATEEKFISTFNTASESGKINDLEVLVKKFNGLCKEKNIDNIFKAILNKDNNEHYKVTIGSYFDYETSIIGSQNTTSGERNTFIESITIDLLNKHFKIKVKELETLFGYKLKDIGLKEIKKSNTVEEFVEILNLISNYLIIRDEGVNKQDSGIGGAYNTVNYNDWDNDLLAVAIVDDCLSGSDTIFGLDIIEDSLEKSYAFVDRFEFNVWEDILLDEVNFELSQYDVLIVDDYNIDDSFIQNYELSWREKQQLASWVIGGGALYLTSATSNTPNSKIKDLIFPAEWLELQTSNALIDSSFDNDFSELTDLTYAEDSGAFNPASFRTATNEDDGNWQWDNLGLTGIRLEDEIGIDYMQIWESEINGNGEICADRSSVPFYVKDDETFTYETRIAPYANSDYNLSMEWAFGVQIGYFDAFGVKYYAYALIGWDDNNLVAGITLQTNPNEDQMLNDQFGVNFDTSFIDVLPEPTIIEDFILNNNEWHTLAISIDTNALADENEITYYIDGVVLRFEQTNMLSLLTNPTFDIKFGIKSFGNGEYNSLKIDYLATSPLSNKNVGVWKPLVDTPEAVYRSDYLSPLGEFAYKYDVNGLNPSCLRIGTIQPTTGELYDTLETDYTVSVEQRFLVPYNFYSAEIYIDFKELVNLDSDVLYIDLLNRNGEIFCRELVCSEEHQYQNAWLNFRVDITNYLRQYSGDTVTVRVSAAGLPDVYAIDETDHIHSDYLVDNLLVSLKGGNIPTLIYHDTDILNNLAYTDIGEWEGTEIEFYNSIHPFYSRVFADEIIMNLQKEGITNVQKVTTEQLLDYVYLNYPAIIINTHPFASELYNGDIDSPIIKWVKESGGALIDTLQEPFAFYLDKNINEKYEMRYVQNADMILFDYDLYKSNFQKDPNSIWLEGWNLREKITLTNPTTSPQVDIPFYIPLTKLVGMEPDFSDICFTSSDGITLLSYEIDSYNSTHANIWVNIPNLPANPNSIDIFVYYNNPTASNFEDISGVWSNAFEIVMHMNEPDFEGSFIDSSPDDITTLFNSVNTNSGVIGDGAEFNNDGWIALDKFFDENTFETIPEMTAYAWFKTNESGAEYSTNWAILDFDRSEFFCFFIRDDDGRVGFSTDGGTLGVDDLYSTNSFNDGLWHYAVVVYDGLDKYIYVDGVQEAYISNPHGGSNLGINQALRYGFIGDGSEATTFNGLRNERYFNGLLDEVGFIADSRNSDWAFTTYHLIKNSANFITYSVPETRPTILNIYSENFDDWTSVFKQSDSNYWNCLSEITLDNGDYYNNNWLTLTNGDFYNAINSPSGSRFSNNGYFSIWKDSFNDFGSVSYTYNTNNVNSFYGYAVDVTYNNAPANFDTFGISTICDDTIDNMRYFSIQYSPLEQKLRMGVTDTSIPTWTFIDYIEYNFTWNLGEYHSLEIYIESLSEAERWIGFGIDGVIQRNESIDLTFWNYENIDCLNSINIGVKNSASGSGIISINKLAYLAPEDIELNYLFESLIGGYLEGSFIDDWFDNDCYDKKDIIITNNNDVLYDYPLYLKIPYSEGMQDDFADLSFYYNNIKLSYEIDSYIENSEVNVWIRIPVLFSGDTIISMYYNDPLAFDKTNSESVWINDYTLVHHFEEESDELFIDSTQFNIGGINHGITQETVGIIDNSIQFDEVDSFNITTTSLDLMDSFAIEAWICMEFSHVTNGKQYIYHKQNSTNPLISIWVEDELLTFGRLVFQIQPPFEETPIEINYVIPSFSYNTWYYIVAQFDDINNIMSLFVNGVLVVDFEYNFQLASGIYHTFGNLEDNGLYGWLGRIDELRISTLPKTNDWYKFTYDQIIEQNNTVTLGIEEKFVYTAFEFGNDEGIPLNVPLLTNYLIHVDLYLENFVNITVTGLNQNDEIIKLVICLGSNFEDYWNEIDKTYYLSIPLDSIETPSDLLLYDWNVITIDPTIVPIVTQNEEYTITEIDYVDFETYESVIKIDNFWVGNASSCMMIPGEWVVDSLQPFSSDYPLSLTVFEQMKSDLGAAFTYRVFGRSEGIRKLLFKDEFNQEFYPVYDQWCEPPIDDWILFGQEVDVINSHSFIGDYSLSWAVTDLGGYISIDINSFDASSYPVLQLTSRINTTTYNDNIWQNGTEPMVKLFDTQGNSIEFSWYFGLKNIWLTNNFILDQGVMNGNFNISMISSIDFILPKDISATDLLVFIDGLHFVKEIDETVWEYNSLVYAIDGKAVLSGNQSEALIQMKTFFGIGKIEFAISHDPFGQFAIGFIDNDVDNGAYFDYCSINPISFNAKVISNGSIQTQTINLIDIDYSSLHHYKIDRQENYISFYIDEVLVAHFTDNLPDTKSTNLKLTFQAVYGEMYIDWIKHTEYLVEVEIDEIINSIYYGEAFYEDFSYRENFPRTEVDNGEDWWYIPDKECDRVETSLIPNYDTWEDVFFSEYDGDRDDPGTMPYESNKEILEYRFDDDSVSNYHALIQLNWWQESKKGGRYFAIMLYNYNEINDTYTRHGYISLNDAWTSNDGRYYIDNGLDNSYINAPLSGPVGGVYFEFERTNGDDLYLRILEADKETEIWSRSNMAASTTALNCIRIYNFGYWGADMEPPGSTYSPSHSKVWIDDIEITGDFITPKIEITEGGIFKIPFDIIGDTFVDPVLMKFKGGWFGFAKNTPIKPTSIDMNEEYHETAEWLSHIIKDYLINQIEPVFDLTWLSINPELLIVNPSSNIGNSMLRYPYDIAGLTNTFDSKLTSLGLLNLEPNIFFEPLLSFNNIQEEQTFELDNNGYIQNWVTYIQENKGMDEYYDNGYITEWSDNFITDTILYYNDFKPNNEKLGQNEYVNIPSGSDSGIWQFNDYGLSDWIGDYGSGIVYDEYFDNWVLRLGKRSLIEDPNFEQLYTLDETNPNSNHFIISDYDGSDDLARREFYVGNPSPSVFWFHPDDRNLYNVAFGNRINLTHAKDIGLPLAYEVEFDYYITHAEDIPVQFTIKFIKPFNDTDTTNPEDWSDYTTSGDYLVIDQESFPVVMPESNGFYHFETNHFCDSLKNEISNAPDSYNSVGFIIIEAEMTGIENQTIYIDNVNVFPDTYQLPNGYVEDSGEYVTSDWTLSTNGWNWQPYNSPVGVRDANQDYFWIQPNTNDYAGVYVEANDLSISGATKFVISAELSGADLTYADAFSLAVKIDESHYARIMFDNIILGGQSIPHVISGISSGLTMDNDWITQGEYLYDINNDPLAFNEYSIIVDYDNNWIAYALDDVVIRNSTVDFTYAALGSEVDNVYIGTRVMDPPHGPNTVFVKNFNVAIFDHLVLSSSQDHGIGDGYGAHIDYNLAYYQGDYFDYTTDSKVILYPYIITEGWSTTDNFFLGGDFEFKIKMYDPTNQQNIWIHYCWSQDELLYGGHKPNEVLQENDGIHFYIHRAEYITTFEQNILFDVYDALNLLTKNSGIIIDREKIVYDFSFDISLENANNLQLSSIAIIGIDKGREVVVGPYNELSLTDIYGSIIGRSNTMLIANSFVYSDYQRPVCIRMTGSVEWKLYVNNILMNCSNGINYDLFDGKEQKIQDTVVMLQPGLNQISIVTHNDECFDSFYFSTDVAVQILEYGSKIGDIKYITDGLQVLTTPLIYDCIPAVRGSIGQGSITLLTLNYDDISSHSDISDFYANIFVNEYEQRRMKSRALKDTFFAAVEQQLLVGHYNLPYDWENKDDPFAQYTPTEIMFIAEEWLQEINRDYYTAMAKGRTKLDETSTSEYNEFYHILKEIIWGAHLGGNEEIFNPFNPAGVDISWQVDWSLYEERSDGSSVWGCEPEMMKSIEFTIDEEFCWGYLGNYYEAGVHVPCDPDAVNVHTFGFMLGDQYEITPGVFVTSLDMRIGQHLFFAEANLKEEYDFWNQDTNEWYHVYYTSSLGKAIIYSTGKIFIEEPFEIISNAMGTSRNIVETYLEDDQWVTLPEMLQAMAYVMNYQDLALLDPHAAPWDKSGYTIDLVNEDFGNSIGTDLSSFWDNTLTEGLGAWVEGIQDRLFLTAYETAYALLENADEQYMQQLGFNTDIDTSASGGLNDITLWDLINYIAKYHPDFIQELQQDGIDLLSMDLNDLLNKFPDIVQKYFLEMLEEDEEFGPSIRIITYLAPIAGLTLIERITNLGYWGKTDPVHFQGGDFIRNGQTVKGRQLEMSYEFLDIFTNNIHQFTRQTISTIALETIFRDSLAILMAGEFLGDKIIVNNYLMQKTPMVWVPTQIDSSSDTSRWGLFTLSGNNEGQSQFPASAPWQVGLTRVDRMLVYTGNDIGIIQVPTQSWLSDPEQFNFAMQNFYDNQADKTLNPLKNGLPPLGDPLFVDQINIDGIIRIVNYYQISFDDINGMEMGTNIIVGVYDSPGGFGHEYFIKTWFEGHKPIQGREGIDWVLVDVALSNYPDVTIQKYRTIKDSERATYGVAGTDDVETVLNSLTNLEPGHPLFRGLFTTPEEAYHEIMGLGLIPFVFGDGLGENSDKKCVIWRDVASVAIELTPSKDRSSTRHRFLKYSEVMKNGKTYCVANGETRDKSTDDERLLETDLVLANIFPVQTDYSDLQESVVSMTRTNEGLKSEWLSALMAEIPLARTMYNSYLIEKRNGINSIEGETEKHRVNDITNQFVALIATALTEQVLAAKANGKLIYIEGVRLDTIFVGSPQEVYHAVWQAVIEQIKMHHQATGSDNVLGLQMQKAGVEAFRGFSKEQLSPITVLELLTSSNVFESLWAFGNLDTFFDAKYYGLEEGNNAFTKITQKMVAEKDLARVMAREKEITKYDGNVPKISGAAFELSGMFDSFRMLEFKSGLKIPFYEIQNVDPKFATSALMHQLGGFAGIHESDFKDGKYRPIIIPIKLLTLTHNKIADHNRITDINGNPLFGTSGNSIIGYDFGRFAKYAWTPGGQKFATCEIVDKMTNSALQGVLESHYYPMMLTEGIYREGDYNFEFVTDFLDKFNIWTEYVDPIISNLQAPNSLQISNSNFFPNQLTPIILEDISGIFSEQGQIMTKNMVSDLEMLISGSCQAETGYLFRKLGLIDKSQDYWHRIVAAGMQVSIDSNTEYSLLQYMLDQVICYDYNSDTGEYNFYKLVVTQEIKSDGTPDLDSKGNPIYKLHIIDLKNAKIRVRNVNDESTLTSDLKTHVIGTPSESIVVDILVTQFGGQDVLAANFFNLKETQTHKVEKTGNTNGGNQDVEFVVPVQGGELDSDIRTNLADILSNIDLDYQGNPLNIASTKEDVVNTATIGNKILSDLRSLAHEALIEIRDKNLDGWFKDSITSAENAVQKQLYVHYIKNCAPVGFLYKSIKTVAKNAARPLGELIRTATSISMYCLFALGMVAEFLYKSRSFNKKNFRLVTANKMLDKAFARQAAYYKAVTGEDINGLTPQSFYGVTNTRIKTRMYFSTTKGIMIHASGLMVTNFLGGLGNQLALQLLLVPIIEYFMLVGYLHEMKVNIESMTGDGLSLGNKGNIINSYDCSSEAIAEYGANSTVITQHNLTRHEDAMSYAVSTWVTDYVEWGGEFWELVNGYQNGRQSARIDLGMTPVFGRDPVYLQDPIRTLICRKGIYQLQGEEVPYYLTNIEEFVVNPTFKWWWSAVLFTLGATISVFTEIAEVGFHIILSGGVSGLCSSMLMGSVVAIFYSSLYEAIGVGSAKSSYIRFIRYSGIGDPGDDTISYWYKVKTLLLFDRLFSINNFNTIYMLAGSILILIGVIIALVMGATNPYLFVTLALTIAYIFTVIAWNLYRKYLNETDPSLLGDPSLF
ncbi:MAG: DUF2341 domain-containing protein [Candidatus Heimdallarchaeota archaeon]